MAPGLLLALVLGAQEAPADLMLLARHQGEDGGWGRRPSGCGCSFTPKWPAAPVEPDAATKASVERLIGRLAEDEIEVRSAAERELFRIGLAAVPQLRAGASGSGAETAARCRGILERLGGAPGLDAELSGLALLAFMGAGYSHLSRDVYDGICFGKVVRSGLDALKRCQEVDGSFNSKEPLANAVAALAMHEAYSLTASDHWKESARKGVASVERHVSKDPALTVWKVLVARSASTDQNWREATETVRAMHGRLAAAPGPTALSGTVILEAMLDRRFGGPRAEALSKLDPASLSTEELMFSCFAMRAAWKPSEASSKEWMEKLKERVLKRDARPECGRGELSSMIRGLSFRMLTLESYYRYGNALGAPFGP